jgi:hypothetical protein
LDRNVFLELLEVIFAWKFKHEDKLILLYNPSNEIKNFHLEDLNKVLGVLGYEVQNVMDTLARAYNEISKEDLIKQKLENGTDTK